jgi:hypothetical protein
MIETRSPLESLAAFAITFVAGIVTTLLVKRHVDMAVKEALHSEESV